ncbi:CAP10 domain-containing protein [Balamuthia mandrillaris]
MPESSSVCQRGKRSQLAKDQNDFQPLSIAEAKEFSYAPFLLDVPSFLHPHHRQYWLELPDVQQLIRHSSSCPSSICHLLTTPEAEGDREEGEEKDSAFLLTFDPNSYRKIAFWGQNYTRGEVTVVKNGVWRQDRPKLRWKSADLCDWNADWRWIVPSTEEEGKEHKKRVAIKRKEKHVNRLILTATPESWSFQHWLDGLFPKLIQAWPWFRDGTWDVLGEGRMQPTTQKLWDTIGLHVPPSTAAANYDSILQEQQTVILVEDATTIFTANEMLFPCVAPVYHPYLWHRMQHELLVSHQYEAEEKGEEEDEGEGERNVVLYMSRGSEEDDEEEKGEEEVERKRTLKKMTRNKERTISNEKELLQSIQQALLDRNLSEQLVLFDDLFSSLSSSSLSKLHNFLQKRVKALIGPHGGAFYNMRFCRRGTFIVELLPKSRPVLTFWWEARLGGHRYWLLPVESDKEKGHQMKANVSDIYQLIRYHLF